MISAIKTFIRGARDASSNIQNPIVNREQPAVAKRPPDWTGRTVAPPTAQPAVNRPAVVRPVAPGPTTAQMRRYANSIESKYQRGVDAKVRAHGEKVDHFIEASRKRAVSGENALQERSVLRRAQPRRVFGGANSKIPHAFETPTVFVTPEGSRIHVDAMRRQRPGPPPAKHRQKDFDAIQKFDKKQATVSDEDGRKHAGKIVSTAGRLRNPFQLASLAEADEPSFDQVSTSDPATSLPDVPNSGEPS